ncbi:hypothetical protein Glove_212g44 [Diversispora epigaea]|uniref:MHD domain-containing protein n=1 Tax=Diversispora epigaea TaxID=1348612 RepID=A0A397IPF0_9GLOM|nr:hypothetical protein Glove_212g44 [Diversispora epigaea]
MISQFFILSPHRGDTLVFRDYRNEVSRDAPDLLLDKLTNWHKENGQEQAPPPFFEIDGVHFLFIQTHDLYFVCTTKFDVSPFMTFELLDRIATLIKDFCGSLSEEILRLNSGLVYELLDEIIDCGYPQTTSTDKLKSYVYEEPIPVKRNNIIMDSLAKLKAPSINIGNSNCRPINIRDERNSRHNEIFIDIIERVVASFASNGMTVQAEIDGSIKVKSYLQGNPEIQLALNSNIILDRDSEITDDRYGIIFDDYKFHDSVDVSGFKENRRMTIFPPEGENIIMNYRITSNISLPFRVFPLVLHVPGHPKRMDVTIRIRADFPEDKIATKCTIIIPLPHVTQSVSYEQLNDNAGQSAQYDNKIQKVILTINKLKGGSERSIKLKLTGSVPYLPAAQLEVGPINLEFDIQNYTSSKIQIRRLKVHEKNNALPPQRRWIRFYTISEKMNKMKEKLIYEKEKNELILQKKIEKENRDFSTSKIRRKDLE